MAHFLAKRDQLPHLRRSLDSPRNRLPHDCTTAIQRDTIPPPFRHSGCRVSHHDLLVCWLHRVSCMVDWSTLLGLSLQCCNSCRCVWSFHLVCQITKSMLQLLTVGTGCCLLSLASWLSFTTPELAMPALQQRARSRLMSVSIKACKMSAPLRF